MPFKKNFVCKFIFQTYEIKKKIQAPYILATDTLIK